MRKRGGAILITSLWMLAILAILAMGIGFRVSIEARLAKYNMEGSTALYLAKAGVVKSIYRVSKMPSVSDSIYECGTVFTAEEKSDPAKLKAIFYSPLGAGVFSVEYKEGGKAYPGVSDEERRININTAPEDVLKNLLMYVGEDPTIASGIVQWRNKGPGLDDGYYEALPAPYKCKHERFGAAEELILVKGMDKKIFDKIKDYITITGDPAKFAVNINTAAKTVLSALITAFTGVDKTAADIYADRIIVFRNGPDGEKGTKDDSSFTSDLSIERILPELSAAQAAELKKYFTTASKYFRIDSQGLITRTKVERRVVSIIQKEQGKAPTLNYYREY